jgi:preprotein translocase subunit SecG
MPVPQAAEKTGTPNVYKVAFAIKPGETRIDITYNVPFNAPGTFEGKILYKGGPTRLVAPSGVTIHGDNIQPIGQEPKTQATIFDVKGNDFKAEISGAGSLEGAEEAGGESGGASYEEIKPKVYSKMTWILALTFGILTLGFILLYRARVPETAAAAARETRNPPAKGKNERRRR